MKNLFLKNKKNQVVLITLGLCLISLQFQNCSDVSFSSSSNKTSSGPGSVGSGTLGTLSETQSFKFGPRSNAIDILVVVDNSGSMEKEQQSLGIGFNNFIAGLNGLDWQIGVTTTDVKDSGRFIGPADDARLTPYSTSYILKPTTPNVANLFANTVQRTTSAGVYLSGSGTERGIASTNLTIAGKDNPDIAQGFFRQNSNLAVVILSDEDEASCGNDPTRADCKGQFVAFDDLDYPQILINNFSKAFNGTKSLLVNAILVKPNDTTCFNLQNDPNGAYGDGGKYGLVYSQLVGMTAGVMGSICDNGAGGFANDLVNISTSISNQVNPQTITLNFVPASTPKVTFDPATTSITYNWVPNTQQITFSNYPENTTITVTYDHTK
jgi:hypothetical protein